ncbi:hypothetical protein OPKNFCMD_0703 [Methylobacterium crusticola]|uniref:TadE-like domain-containing protein n=1 Tax=Methylobacterium crusticola TaxID=1697972 RepID=A0ABQ4QSX0_9HYPH|nr:TadE/TadG family type IV pilus assembly protein [Methylobacterium crusticola]GJD47990.1 hypothetical protein OPKNFCMD_0703 [Methylobacterium crusticola]
MRRSSGEAQARGADRADPGGRAGRLGRRALALAGDREGVAAVEFAMVAMPFLILLAAIMETALGFFAAQNLDNAVADAARQIYTGQFQAARASDPTPPTGTTSQQVATQKFKDAICTGRVTLFDCSKIKVDVLAPADSASFTPPSPVDAGTKAWRTDFGTAYQSPGPSQIVIVQAAVEYPVFFGFMNPNILSNGARVLQSTVAFKTEPFQ